MVRALTRPTRHARCSWLIVLVALGGIVWTAAARPSQQSDGQPPARDSTTARPARFEYARVVIDEGVAVLITDEAIQKIEIPIEPPRDTTVYRNQIGAFQKRFDALLYSLNACGAMGWELTPGKMPSEGDEILVRRAR